MTTRHINVMNDTLSPHPEIARWLWAFEDARERTMEELAEVSPDMVDWIPPDEASSIGSVLYHIAGIEADWLYVEVLEGEFPPEVADLFPHPFRDKQGRLTQVLGLTLEAHLSTLSTVRAMYLAEIQKMDPEEFGRVRTFPHCDVTPEWVMHHLLQHEAEHRSQIGALRIAAKREGGGNEV
jgi:uncharacterized damage-inducible protein DinB